MPQPAYTKTWVQALTTGVPGIRIPFVSVLDTSQVAAFTLKNFLVTASTATTKYTLQCSCSGGVGPTNLSDNTDRIPNAAAWTPRATAANQSQAWMLLKDALGRQILICFQGSADHIWRISFSPGGLFVLAGTTNQQPTATDEQVVLTGTTIVNSTASADRIMQIWARDDGKGFRVAFFRSLAIAAPIWFIEEFDNAASTGFSGVTITPVHGGVCDVPSGGANSSNLNANFAANSIGSLFKAVISSVVLSVTCSWGTVMIAGASAGALTNPSHLQGGVWIPYPLFLGSSQANTVGLAGQFIDAYQVQPSGVVVGNGFGNSYQWVHVGQSFIWPNPSNVQMTMN